MSRKVLAVIELDADGTLHFTAAELPDSLDAFERVVKRQTARRELTWFAQVHKFQTGSIRDVSMHAQGVPSVRVEQLGIYDTLQDSLRVLVTGKKALP